MEMCKNKKKSFTLACPNTMSSYQKIIFKMHLLYMTQSHFHYSQLQWKVMRLVNMLLD